MTEQWTVSGEKNSTQSRVFFCSDTYIFGGPGYLKTNGYFERAYSTIPTHSVIYFQIRVHIIDNWKFPDQFQIIFDGHQPISLNPVMTRTFYGQNVCGNSDPDLHNYYIQGKVLHTENTLKLTIISYIQQEPKYASFGIRDIRLLFATKKPTDDEEACVAITESYSANAAVGIGNCVCPYGRYYNGATCQPCHTSCLSCFGSANTQCFACKNSFYWNGNNCASCPSNCLYCSSGTECTVCSPGYYLDRYFTCQLTCPLPYLPLGDGVFWVCQTPCQPDNFMYWDNTCESSCDPGLTTRIEGSAKFCDFPCTNPNDYLHWDGPSCVSICTTQPRIKHGKKFCYPCPDGLYLYPNGTCISFCEIPYTTQIIGGADYCQPLCNPGEYLIGNQCFTSCTSPLYSENIHGLKVCKSPCPNDFYYWNGTCLSTCPLNQRFFGIYKFCDACLNNYFLYPDGTCKPTCDPPRQYFTEDIFQICYFPCGGSSGVYNADSYADCPALYEYPLHLTLKGECMLNLSGQEYEQANTIGQVLNKFSGIVSVLAVIAIVINPRDGRPFCLILSIKMLEYLKYIIAKYPPLLQQVFNTLNFNLGVMNIAPDVSSEAIEKFERYSVPHQYNEFKFHSSFIVNSWDALVSFVVIGIIIGFVLVSEAIFKDKKYVSWLIQKIKPAIKLPTFLVLFLLSSYYIDINIHTSLELRTLHLFSFLAVLSFLTALAMNGLLIFMIVKVFLAFKEARKILTQVADAINPSLHSRDLQKISDYYIFFAICSKEAYYQHAFIFVSIIRVYVFSFVLGYMFEHAFVQSVLALILSGMMLLYLIFVQPLKRLSHLIQFIVMEATLLVPNLCVVIMNAMNGVCSESHEFRSVLGGLIIACNFVLLVGGMGCLIFAIVRRAFGKDIIEDFKAGRTDFKRRNDNEDAFETMLRNRDIQNDIITVPVPDVDAIRRKRNDDFVQRDNTEVENIEFTRPQEVEMSGIGIRHDTSSKLMMLNTNESQLVIPPDPNGNVNLENEDNYEFDNSQLDVTRNHGHGSDDDEDRNKRRKQYN